MSQPESSTKSSATKTLAEALVRFQHECPSIHEDGRMKVTKDLSASYATLPGILSTIGPALRNCGLAVIQLPEAIDGKPGLRTTLLHTSGEQMTSVTPLVVGAGRNDTQEWGKAMTYTRRYALNAALNICAGIEDNDAASTEDVADETPKAVPSRPHRAEKAIPVPEGERHAPRPVKQRPEVKFIDETLKAQIVAAIKALNEEDKAGLKKAFKDYFKISAADSLIGPNHITLPKHGEWWSEQLGLAHQLTAA